MPSYLSFARFYDGLMQDACYEKRCDYILKLAESFGHDMGITLDLACGTGTLTRLLKKREWMFSELITVWKCSARQCKVPPKKGLISCF